MKVRIIILQIRWCEFHYLFLVKFYISKVFSLELGPQFSFIPSNEDGKNGLIKSSNAVEIAAALGTSFNITRHVGVFTRYNKALTNFKGSDTSVTSESKYKSNNLQLGAYFRF